MRRAPVLALSLGLLLLGVVASGHATFTGARVGAAPSAGAGFVGAWRVTVSSPPRPSFPSLLTFAADGTLLVADPPVSPAPPRAPFKLDFASGGHGAWTSTGERTMAFTFLELHADETGASNGTLTVRGTGALDATGGALTGRFTFDITDPTGKVVVASAGTFQGTRIVVQPMGTPMATPSS